MKAHFRGRGRLPGQMDTPRGPARAVYLGCSKESHVALLKMMILLQKSMVVHVNIAGYPIYNMLCMVILFPWQSDHDDAEIAEEIVIPAASSTKVYTSLVG